MRKQRQKGEGFNRRPRLLDGRIPMVSLLQTLAVAEHLNFCHAANALGVTQSSVSTRIKALEETLGIVLFERRHRGVRLTEAGRRFVAQVTVGIEQLDHAVQTAGAVTNNLFGQISIGLRGSIAFGFLAELRHRYRVAYPGVEQAITEGSSPQTIALVRDGRLDVAFVVNVADVPDCCTHQLWRETLMIVLPEGHHLASMEAFTWDHLTSETFLIRQGGASLQMFEHIVRRFAERGMSARIHRCDVGRDTLMHMVAANEGITLTTESVTKIHFPGVLFVPITDEPEQVRFGAVWSPHNQNPALRKFLDLAIAMSRSARAGWDSRQ